jgi:predicted phage terminase large subunit-like protein
VTKLPPATKAKILERAHAARSDFDIFLDLVWQFSPMKHQKQWLKELKRVTSGEETELLIVAPRGSGKSAVVGVHFLAWVIGGNPENHYGLISYQDDVAWRRSRAIRNIIEYDPVYHLIFPEIKPDKANWSRDSFTVKRADKSDLHPTLIASGSASGIISARLDGVVYDDPHDEKNAKSATKRRQVVETWDNAIEPCLQFLGWVIGIATRYADDDLPGVFIKRGFRYIHQRAITQSYKKGRKPARKELSYAPKLASLSWLRQKRERNPATFAFQYQGDTTGGDTKGIRKLHTYQENDLPPRDKLLIQCGTDTNYKDGEENDYCVIFVGGLDTKGNVWMLHKEKGRWDVDDLADLFIQLHNDWHYSNNWIEDAGKGTPAVDVLQRKAAHVPKELQAPSRGGKRSRVAAISPYINSGQVRWPAAASWLKETEYELKHAGHTEFDDEPDAAYMLLHNLLQAIHPEKYGMGRPKRRVTIGGGRFGKKTRHRLGRR